MLDLLERDHTCVTDLLEAYEHLESDAEEEALVSRVIREPGIRVSMEDKSFLPIPGQLACDTKVVDDASA